MSKRELLAAAKSLCEAFAQGKSTEEILAHFTEHEAVAIEHGHQSLAPWLGREFIGHKEIAKYFEQVAETLDSDGIIFSDYFADEDNYRVGVTGKTRWTHKKTGKSWNETFTCTLDYAEGQSEEGDNSKRELKVRRYAVWADSGALYLAGRGDPTLQ
ncbi:hypothetical protein BDZ91DRAFT_709901 [Kalaharituber pfeilii]|nr:hypothetical protein BDZ91DRAFT_709901 [Kalaharituber pfeilii]